MLRVSYNPCLYNHERRKQRPRHNHKCLSTAPHILEFTSMQYLFHTVLCCNHIARNTQQPVYSQWVHKFSVIRWWPVSSKLFARAVAQCWLRFLADQVSDKQPFSLTWVPTYFWFWESQHCRITSNWGFRGDGTQPDKEADTCNNVTEPV